MSQAFPNNRDESRSFVRQPYGVGLGPDYGSYRTELLERLKYVLSEGETPTDGNKDLNNKAETVLRDMESTNTEGGFDMTLMHKKPSVADSSIFGNDVLNPYAGFCRDDDIVHTSYTNGNEHEYGMGRVYDEIYNSTQQVCYIQFGLPKYRSLMTYLYNASDGDMTDLEEHGDPGIVSKLGSLLKDGMVLAIKLPWLPLEWSWRALKAFNLSLDSTKVTEYFYFKETMMLYYRHVNTILSHLAVDMGLFNNFSKTENSPNKDTIPKILQGGPDIYRILVQRSERFGATPTSTDATLEDSLKDGDPAEEPGFFDKLATTVSEGWNKFWGHVAQGVSSGFLDNNKFIAFRIEKGSDNASENFSNTIQESSLQQRLNGLVTQNREVNLDANQGSGLIDFGARQFRRATAAIDKFKSLFSGDKTKIAGGIIEYCASGNGFYDLPQQWRGSSFSRSVSINIRLRSKTGGDPVSIYTNLMVPFACLLAGVMPRQGGDGTYVSPFICRCWCRGMFAVPAGIIQSLSATRGDSEYGWSLGRLPTTISVSIQIADLSPILFLGMAGNGVWEQAFNNNTKLHEYLNTLSGLGLKERYYPFQQFRRNLDVLTLILKNQTFSATVWGMSLADTSFGRFASMFAPVRAMRLNNN